MHGHSRPKDTETEVLGFARACDSAAGVDVTAAFRGEVVATQFCDERSMIRILTEDPTVKAQVLREMELKREKAAETFGDPTM